MEWLPALVAGATLVGSAGFWIMIGSRLGKVETTMAHMRELLEQDLENVKKDIKDLRNRDSDLEDWRRTAEHQLTTLEAKD